MVFYRMRIKDFLDGKDTFLTDDSLGNATGTGQKPDGLTMDCSWDKNSDSSGESTIYLPKELHSLMKLYFDKRLKQFGLEKRFRAQMLDLNQLFFVNGNGKPFKSPSLKHVTVDSDTNVKVVPYHYRKKVSTWGQNHADPEVQGNEAEALQHRPEVARQRYDLTKAKKTVTFVDTYKTEQDAFPLKIAESISKTEEKLKDVLEEHNNIGKEMRKNELMKESEDKQILRKQN